MALQMHPSRAAEIRLQGGLALAQGVAGAGKSIGEGLGGLLKSYRENKEERESTTAALDLINKYVTSDPELLQTYGEELAKAPGMSNSQRKGLIGGLTSALALKGQRLQQQKDAEILKSYQEAGRNARLQPAFMGKLSEYLGGADIPGVTGGPMGAPATGADPLRAVARAAQETGYQVQPGQLDDIIRAVASSRAQETRVAEPPQMLKIEGAPPIVWSAHTGKWEFVPSQETKQPVIKPADLARMRTALVGQLADPRFRDPAARTKVQSQIDALDRQWAEFLAPREGGAAGATNDPLGLFK